MYNLNEIENLNTDELHRPKTVPVIFKVDVIENPFENLYPRDIKWDGDIKSINPVIDVPIKKTQNVLKKRLKLESSDSENESNFRNLKVKSSHDMLSDKHLLKQSVELKKIKTEKVESDVKEINNQPATRIQVDHTNDDQDPVFNQNEDPKISQQRIDIDRQANMLKQKIAGLNTKDFKQLVR